jgi:wobble nucleotide-excising tRNase
MFKAIKKIKNVGIYKDFKWDGAISPLRKHSLFFGFNGTGKTTISRIFSALSTGDEKAFDKGYEIELTTHDNQTLKIDKNQKYENIFVYNEDYVDSNFSWQDADKVGATAFVVIGKKSKEQEEALKENTVLQEKYKGEMESLRKEINAKKKSIDEKSTAHAKKMSDELTKYNQQKYKKYAKTHIEKEIEKLQQITAEQIAKIDEASEREKLNQNKMDEIRPVPQFETQFLSNLVSKIKEYLILTKPDKVEMLLSSLELEWVKEGVPLHEHKANCLYCGNTLSDEKKEEINKIINNAVAAFVNTGTRLINEIDKLKLPAQLPLTTSQLYSDLSSELTPIIESYGLFLDTVGKWMNEAREKIVAHKDYNTFEINFNTQTTLLNDDVKSINAKLKELAEKHNNRSLDFKKVQEEALNNIELIYLSKYMAEVKQLTLDKKEKEALYFTAKSDHDKATDVVNEIQSTLASEGKAALEINEMLGKFLGRKDIRIEFSEQDSKFILKRNDKIAKKLSEGEKTAISVCYFLISVRANPETVADRIVVIDDPVTSLDSTNVYSAFSMLRSYLKDVKQLIVLTHSLVFFRLIYRWFSKSGEGANSNSYFSVINTISGSERVASIKTLSGNDRDANTEYVLIYKSLKKFIELNRDVTDLSSLDSLPYPNMLRKLLEIYTTSRRPGWNGENYNKLFQELGMSEDIALKADRFCNDFSHGKGDALIGPDMESFSASNTIISEIISELERIDENHFASIGIK